MKRKIIALIAVVALALSLTACGKFTCDMCGQEKGGKQHKSEMLGVEVVICDDCYKGMDALFG